MRIQDRNGVVAVVDKDTAAFVLAQGGWTEVKPPVKKSASK